MEGLPKDETEFISYLMDVSCHPKAARRILDRIRKNGFDLLTVMPRLDFDEIAFGLRKMGVSISIIDPQPGWKERYEDGPYPPDFIPPPSRKIKK